MQLNLVIHLLIHSSNICAQHKHMNELSMEALHTFCKHWLNFHCPKYQTYIDGDIIDIKNFPDM